MSDEKIVCFVCKKSDEHIIIFSEETLKKCQTILKLRKIHNLKYRDIILPSEYTESGYHRVCYKSVSTESPTTSQPAPICESIDLQSATLQDISDVFEPEVSDNNFVSQDVNISTDNIAGKNDNEVVCIFCNKKKKKVRSRMLPLHAADVQQFKDSVKPNIESHKEFTDFSNKLDNFSGSKIYYHTECRVDFNNKLSSLKATPSKKEWHYHREYHQTVFNEISTIIKEDVIKKGRCFLLVYLHESYIDLLEKIFQENSIQMTATFTAHHLEEKILKVFSKDIKFFTVRNKKILAPKYLEAIDDSVLDNLQQENILQKSALILRKIILQIEKIKLPTKNITSQHLISGEVSIPEELSDFYSTLLGGCNQKRKTGQKCSRLVRSYCQDVIFGVHDGRVKTSKHIMLDTTDEPEMSEVSSENTSPNKKRRRRTFDEINIDEMPYPKKPKMTSELQLSVDDIECIDSQINTEIDNIWMISHALELPDVPMWVGFNSRIDDQDSPQQHISYLTPINASPTSTSIVLETMKQSQKIAEDLQQPYIQVTYDLAIAKVALQIQATENPTFDNLFIHLGPFHIMMAYFKAIGKVISDCGLTTVMVESSLLANGSVNGFLDGKHFNRCKRLHPLVALGLEILHFKSFLQNDNITLTEDIIDEVKRLQNCKISLFEIENDGLKELMNNYGIYKQQTLNGEHGKTSQFYLIYINLIHHYLDLSRSIRTGNFQLFKSVLPKITSIFFVLNQQNYARWSVKYYDSLLRVDKTHPDLYEGFLKGCFGIKRTTKPFSRQPIDLVLEQTINAEAARRLTGVIHFTNSISARQRWARNHDVRSTIISQVYLELGLQKHQDISTDLNPHNIRKNAKQLQQFVATFDQFINPFSLEVPKDQLVNISSGKSASLPVEEFLLNLEANGDSLRRTFISECQSDITRFEKAIKKTSINNFSKDYEKKKIKVGGKIQEVKIQRDLFGRMLGISMDYSIDISKILSYPITSVPLSMCHLDGTICKTDKSALMKCLEKEVEHEEPSQIDILIIDGFFLLHTMKNVPRKFGGISKKMLQMVTQLKASRIDVIFDQYFTPSIKGYERSMRFESAQLEYTIAGPEQVRPSDFVKELKNSNFKEALVDFFILHWASDEMAPFIGNKIIHINFRKCHSFTVNEANKVMSSINEELSCPEHEEADNKIVYHACKINYEANIVIRTVDTDVAAIMLSHMHRLNDGSHVWMLTGAGNNLRYVDLTKIHAKLGESICRSLPGLHAFTGCDYNPAFYRKAKLKPYKLLKKYVEFQLAFMKFGDSKIIENNNEQVLIFDIIQSFICYLYNMNDINDVDAARLQMFINSYTVSDVNEAFNRKKLQNFDASCLPPCKSELLQQFLRANYICSIWNNAHLQKPTAYKPVNNGWILENDHYYFKWFEGDQLPNYVSESLKTVPENNEEGDIEDDQSTEWNNSDEEYGCIDDDDENDENV
ncbi:uncharacterized protein LOC124299714 isoform X2 [Neodiprion virginianus]|uniref:uncharacterized protein LOC124299714 isoform X2 n=1 Tax=Neodiprion virginianus TaxID=2961670 RepID=UPI001EE6D75E|nr:uncharacterized protein LOC124299714 isoform X2 [Neodiprion virginianus]